MPESNNLNSNLSSTKSSTNSATSLSRKKDHHGIVPQLDLLLLQSQTYQNTARSSKCSARIYSKRGNEKESVLLPPYSSRLFNNISIKKIDPIHSAREHRVSYQKTLPFTRETAKSIDSTPISQSQYDTRKPRTVRLLGSPHNHKLKQHKRYAEANAARKRKNQHVQKSVFELGRLALVRRSSMITSCAMSDQENNVNVKFYEAESLQRLRKLKQKPLDSGSLDVVSLLECHKMEEIRQAFINADDELSFEQFTNVVWPFITTNKDNISNEKIILALWELFQDIDINDDTQMQWSEFSDFLSASQQHSNDSHTDFHKYEFLVTRKPFRAPPISFKDHIFKNNDGNVLYINIL